MSKKKYTPRFTQLLSMADLIAERNNQTFVGIDHIILALKSDWCFNQRLEAAGINFDPVFTQVKKDISNENVKTSTNPKKLFEK